MNRGFSLLELVVILALIGITFFYTIPRFQQELFPNDAQKAARWLMVYSASIRTRAAAEQKRFILHVGISENRLWITDESMSDAAILTARGNAFVLKEDLRIRNVEFPGRGVITSGVSEIIFFPDGHADAAWIHLDGASEKSASLFIEPFLPKVRYFDVDVGFSG